MSVSRSRRELGDGGASAPPRRPSACAPRPPRAGRRSWCCSAIIPPCCSMSPSSTVIARSLHAAAAGHHRGGLERLAALVGVRERGADHLDALLGALVAVGHDRDGTARRRGSRARRYRRAARGRASRAWRSRARSAAAGAARSPSAARRRPCAPRRPRCCAVTPRRSRSSLSRSSARWSSPTESLVSPPNHDTSGPPRWTCTTISGAPVTPLAATPNSTGSRELSVGAKAAMTGAMVSASWASMRRDARRGPGGPHPPDGMKSPAGVRAPPGRGGVHPRPRSGAGERSGSAPCRLPARPHRCARWRPLPPGPARRGWRPGSCRGRGCCARSPAARELPLVLLAAPGRVRQDDAARGVGRARRAAVQLDPPVGARPGRARRRA